MGDNRSDYGEGVRGISLLTHYQALDHKLEFIKEFDNQSDRITEAAWGQAFLGNAAVDFIWTAVPYRCEWKKLSKALLTKYKAIVYPFAIIYVLNKKTSAVK